MGNSITIVQSFLKIQYYQYWFAAAGATFVIRVILACFKAWAINNGESDDVNNEYEDKWKGEGFKRCFERSFSSDAGDVRIDDYWLPAIIGYSELICFPVFMANNWIPAIAAWIAIKTASSWGGWQKTRTAYNRFLLGNILSLTASFFMYLIFLR
ncbi:MAG: hypothetical protein ACE14U_06640 [Candidatus Velamenicoccus archaeovorus]